jgi:hypothetical protein
VPLSAAETATLPKGEFLNSTAWSSRANPHPHVRVCRHNCQFVDQPPRAGVIRLTFPD